MRRKALTEQHKKKKKKRRLRIQPRFYFLLLALVVVIALIAVLLSMLLGDGSQQPQAGLSQTPKPNVFQQIFATPTPTPTPTPSPTPTPTPTPMLDTPTASDDTLPAKWGFETQVEVNGVQVDAYTRETPIDFGMGENYTDMLGVVTFRGDSFRSGAAYGTAAVTAKSLSKAWSIDTGEMLRGDYGGATDKTWSGSGWVGQPLLVQWPEKTKQNMNMYDWAKNKAGLVEVIYATLQGHVYFIDLETGEKTRDNLVINMPFKGAGALDPRGYPILYLGSGDMYASESQQTRILAYSLLDFTRLYEVGKQLDPFALRQWHAYDSSPLVDAETDTLIYPGENGILYTVKLNTVYDENTGALTMNPSEVVKMRYKASRSGSTTQGDVGNFWLGYESSIACWGGYGYLSTNDGFMQCIDLNAMRIVWAQDIKDDANGSPVLEPDLPNRTAYLYAGVSSHFTKNREMSGEVGFYKIDAVSGQILWVYKKTVTSMNSVSGGVQATAVLGKNSISDLVIVPFSNTYGDTKDGWLVALDKNTGSERWAYHMDNYGWSSPVAVYDAAGNAYIVQADNAGLVHLIDGQTGAHLASFNAEHNCEASPAVYGNYIVIGTRGMKIFGIKIS